MSDRELPFFNEQDRPLPERLISDQVSRQLYFYFARLLTIVVDVPASTAFLLFNQNGVCIFLSGEETLVSDLKSKRLAENSVWKRPALKGSAVTNGLTDGMPHTSICGENPIPLRPYALCFRPIRIRNSQDSTQELNYGGVALLLPKDQYCPDDEILIASLAHDLALNLHFRRVANAMYEQTNRGVLAVDMNMNSPQIMISFCSQRFLRMTNISGRAADYNYVPVETLIDPPPANPEFWALLAERKEITDQYLPLTLKGKTVSCLTTIISYYQPFLRVDNLTFLITTDRDISTGVSRMISNNAILSFDNIIGQSPKLLTSLKKAAKAAQTDSNVLLLGESGVGKDILAQAIHNRSIRKSKPFIAVNCAALPRDLIASELFGYDGGAFTGAKRRGNIGKFELANNGTIFLDEIGELPLDLQSTLLRLVEKKQFSRLGSSRIINVDVKIISATNEDLVSMVEQKRFRADLFYRLSTLQIQIPPLRERGGDVLLLARYFIRACCTKTGRTDEMELSPAAERLLMNLPWPGNIRELQNLIECIVQIYPDRVIRPEHILDNINRNNVARYVDHTPGRPVQKVRERPPVRHLSLTKEMIADALEQCGNNKSAAARYLGISVRTLYRKI